MKVLAKLVLLIIPFVLGSSFWSPASAETITVLYCVVAYPNPGDIPGNVVGSVLTPAYSFCEGGIPDNDDPSVYFKIQPVFAVLNAGNRPEAESFPSGRSCIKQPNQGPGTEAFYACIFLPPGPPLYQGGVPGDPGVLGDFVIQRPGGQTYLFSSSPGDVLGGLISDAPTVDHPHPTKLVSIGVTGSTKPNRTTARHRQRALDWEFPS